MSTNKSKKNASPVKKKNLSLNLIPSNMITTPYERVLSILREAKNYIAKISKENKIIQNLEWAIKVITSRSLYSYEFKEKEAINKLSKENPEFKQLVDFVSEYNEKVIKMYQKYNYILPDKLLLKPSTKLNRHKITRKASFAKINSGVYNLLQLEEDSNNKVHNKNKRAVISNKNNNLGVVLGFKKQTNSNIINYTQINHNNETSLIKKNKNDSISNPFEQSIKRKIAQKKNKKQIININDEIINKSDFVVHDINYYSIRSDGSIKKKLNLNKKNKNRIDLFPSVQKISITINNNNNSNSNDNETNNDTKEDDLPQITIPKKGFTSNNIVNISLTNSIVCHNNAKKSQNKEIIHQTKTINKNKRVTINITKEYSFAKIQNRIIHDGFDSLKLINERNFDAFQLKEIVGYSNILPFVGRIILENLGLIDEEILNTDKLDSFLVSVSSQYFETTLYHNSLHGIDVTQSCYIFFLHSNAEKIAKTNVLDLLSIFIAALGHDIGHPGLTNTYHINDSTDIAITYNDISVLENFHASTLFKTIRRTENNIFEKLTNIDYKIIRKRMISEILATDMANHGKVISLIKSKISTNEDGKDFKFKLFSGNEQTKTEEQQSLLDFMIHLADLAHNTRLFNISLKWVELLSEEFWRQGDLEKKQNLPVSFLCDRDNINIPQSQKGFISGFIIPTFDCLVKIFPTLRFTLDNANNNLKEWQKLLNEGRLRGWTPTKDTHEFERLPKKCATKKYEKNKSGKIVVAKGNVNTSNDKDKDKDKDKNNNQKKKSKFSSSCNSNVINSYLDSNRNSNRNSNNNSNRNSNINFSINKSISKKPSKSITIISYNNTESPMEKMNTIINTDINKINYKNERQNTNSNRFNTPVKLRINDEFKLTPTKKLSELLLNTTRQSNINNNNYIKNNVNNKFVNKRLVNRTKNIK